MHHNYQYLDHNSIKSDSIHIVYQDILQPKKLTSRGAVYIMMRIMVNLITNNLIIIEGR
jgi:hypothetical protein